jgi:Fuc2NAc and GlcNAc transferase
MTTLAWGAAAMILAALAVAAYLRLARRRGWVDAPNHRSSHRRPTPNSGGVAVVPVFIALVAASVALDGPGSAVLRAEVLALLAAAGLICIIGAVDDRRHLPAGPRLTLFLATSTLLVVTVLAPSGVAAWAAAGLLAVGLAWLVNLYNFMDGLDGIAALQCVLVAAMLAAVAHGAAAPPVYTVVAAVLCGSFLAFLLFNWPPAKLFMGDAGSLSAGLVLGWLGLVGWCDGWVPAPVWILLMSPFLLDTGWTLLVRLRRGAPLAQAHREHLYQRLARRWRSHRAVALALLVLHLLWLQPLVLLQLRFPVRAETILLLGLFPQLLLMVRLRRLQ